METPERKAKSTGRQGLAIKASELLRELDGALPVWIRSPTRGPEYFTGLSRAKLYELAGKGLIRTHSLREKGQVKGTRLFHLRSILDFIEQSEQSKH